MGVPLFQEQAMRIAIVGAGFEPGEADRLRRAMATFKRVGTIDSFRDKFLKGMAARGYDAKFALDCWSQIEGFGNYGFPESHAASFANLVYASAWIKCHYPDVFAAALLNSQPMGFYATAQLVRDAQEHGVEVRAGRREQFGLGLHAGSCTRPLERLHPRHASQRGDILTNARHASRLPPGRRLFRGLGQDHRKRPRRGLRFGARSLAAHRPAAAALEKLAHADAFRSLGLSRRDALWAVKALQRAGDKDDLPLFARVAMPELEPDAHLPRCCRASR